jgi:hypothetical protein
VFLSFSKLFLRFHKTELCQGKIPRTVSPKRSKRVQLKKENRRTVIPKMTRKKSGIKENGVQPRVPPPSHKKANLKTPPVYAQSPAASAPAAPVSAPLEAKVSSTERDKKKKRTQYNLKKRAPASAHARTEDNDVKALTEVKKQRGEAVRELMDRAQAQVRQKDDERSASDHSSVSSQGENKSAEKKKKNHKNNEKSDSSSSDDEEEEEHGED